jgi:hypothetical protein
LATPPAAEYGKPEDTERRVGGSREVETEKRIGDFRVNRKVAWGIFYVRERGKSFWVNGALI